MLLERTASLLLIVDVQEKLTPLVADSKAMVDRCEWLLRLAKTLEVPRLFSEQYPKGLAHTLAPLNTYTEESTVIEKVHFSCCREPSFIKALQALNKSQVILAGIETHVCILETALDLKAMGKHVFVVVDAVTSRQHVDHKYGLKRMKSAGIHLVTAEMVFFEWVEKAGTPEFKALSQSFLR